MKNVVNHLIKLLTTIGICIATVVSYTTWKSIAWATLHGLFGWSYVIYYAIMY